MKHTPLPLLLLLLLSSGCSLLTLLEEEPVCLDISACTYPADATTRVQRLLVLPFANESAFEGQQTVIEKAFATALAERARFEVVAIPPEDTDLLTGLDPYTTGRVSLQLLIELGEYYHADAVLLGCLKRYNPYSPPLIGLKADVVAIENGEVLRTVNGILDARDNEVVRDVSHYFEEGCSNSDSLLEWRLITSSPERFARYVSHRLVSELYPSIISNQK